MVDVRRSVLCVLQRMQLECGFLPSESFGESEKRELWGVMDEQCVARCRDEHDASYRGRI